MFRSALGLLLALTMIGQALPQAQPSQPTRDPLESRVGRIITVTETQRTPERCLVVQAWRLPDGRAALKAKSLATGEMMCIVEELRKDSSGPRFLVYRWGLDNLPPPGCPVPPSESQYTAGKTVIASTPSGRSATANTIPCQGQACSSSTSCSAVQPIVQTQAQTPPNTSSSGVVTASGSSSPVVQATTQAQDQQTVRATVIRPGPVIVGQPHVPVVLQGSPEASRAAGQPEPVPTQVSPVAMEPQAHNAQPAGQPEPQPGSSCCCEAGKVILVTEPGRPTQSCEVLSVTHHGLGGRAMHVRNIQTGECFTIVEGGLHRVGNVLSRFRLFRGKEMLPVICANCEPCSGAVPQKAVPEKSVSPMPAPMSSAPKDSDSAQQSDKASGTSKYAASLLPPSQTNPQHSVPPAETAADQKPVAPLAQTTVSARPGQMPKPTSQNASVGNLLKRVWDRISNQPEKPTSSKSKVATLPDVAAVTKAEPPEQPQGQNSNGEPAKTADTDKASAKPAPAAASCSAPPQPKAEGDQTLTVPVPMVPLATSESRPLAPPPQPPVKPFNTMTSASMTQMQVPEMSPKPTAARPEPGHPADTPAGPPVPAVTASVPGGVVTATAWSRGPVTPVKASVAPSTIQTTAAHDQLTLETTVQLLNVLHTSGVPSQREQAAQRLRRCHPSVQSYVVDALITAVKSDAAPLVRVAAIESLRGMGETSPAVVNALRIACQDRDPRVREDAIKALTAMREHADAFAPSTSNQAASMSPRN
jgi:hypothetical protein